MSSTAGFASPAGCYTSEIGASEVVQPEVPSLQTPPKQFVSEGNNVLTVPLRRSYWRFDSRARRRVACASDHLQQG